jgi:2-phosphosulfolactate phosphatase
LANAARLLFGTEQRRRPIERRINEPAAPGRRKKTSEIEGFDLGNSPYDYTPEKVGERKSL